MLQSVSLWSREFEPHARHINPWDEPPSTWIWKLKVPMSRRPRSLQEVKILVLQHLCIESVTWQFDNESSRLDNIWKRFIACVSGLTIMPDSLHPSRLYPDRVLCPWDSPGKNTGACCHFLLQENIPDSGIKPVYPVSSALAGWFFTTVLPILKHLPEGQVSVATLSGDGGIRGLHFWAFFLPC